MRSLGPRLRAIVAGLFGRGEAPRMHVALLWAGRLAIIAPALFLPSFFGFVTFSNQPRFCISCHYMQPFYDAWKTSSHNNVKCVDCHIPPGAKNWLEHKMAAANQVVRYVTRTYGMRPWTEVDDASCLRTGCHETRLLRGQVEFGGVTFDHAPHLTSFRRVTRLRCTSCHAQIVQGTHMTVTETTCFLCHFKNGDKEPEMGDCRRCHDEIRPHRREDISAEAWVEQVPETQRSEPKLAYDHAEVEQREVPCQECHGDVVQGQGEVPPERCITCHSEAARLEKYGDTEFMHRTHVTEHKVDCTRCHQEIEHKLQPRTDLPKLDCTSCHPGQHDETRALYQGSGGKSAAPQGNPMYEVRVPCEGCHNDHQPVDGKRITTKAGAAGCMLCHGEDYGDDLARWQHEAIAWTNWAKAGLQQTTRLLSASGPDTDPTLRERHLKVARDNLALVERGQFVHNPDYAVSLLRAARDHAERALEAAGLAVRWPQEPAHQEDTPEAPRGGPEACGRCHPDAVNRQVTIFGNVFDHRDHAGTAALPCETCHNTNAKPESAGHGRLTIGRDDCRQCHAQRRVASPHEPNWKRLHGSQARKSPGDCQTCHSQASCDNCHGTRIPHGADWVSRHGQAGLNQRACAQCHEPSLCNACHQRAKPDSHNKAWPKTHGQAAKQAPKRCERCHQRSTCRACHGLELPHSAAFRAKQHGPAAAQNPSRCARCHEAGSCSGCHLRKQVRPDNHQAKSWPKEHGAAGHADPVNCQLCHGQEACSTCHEGLVMPHPEGWALEGHGPAATSRPKTCARCHQRSFCQQCHVDEGGQ